MQAEQEVKVSTHTHTHHDPLADEFDSFGKNFLKFLSVFGSLTFAVLYDIISQR